MPKGDFDWASRELADDLGKSWREDTFGHHLLYMALYDSGESPDLRHSAYIAYAGDLKHGGDTPGYMVEMYDYDFDENFDWEAYREWYDSQ